MNFKLNVTINDEKKSFKVYLDDPFSPLNTLESKFHKNLNKSFSNNKKNLIVESKSIDEVINLSGIKKDIDFINIDVEGSDYKILRQVHINKLKPKLISIETHNVDGSESENLESINDFLIKNDFNIFK